MNSAELETATFRRVHRWAPTGDEENIVVVLNFSGEDRSVAVQFPFGGRCEDLLSGYDGGDGWFVDVAGPNAEVPVGAHWGRILWRMNNRQ